MDHLNKNWTGKTLLSDTFNSYFNKNKNTLIMKKKI